MKATFLSAVGSERLRYGRWMDSRLVLWTWKRMMKKTRLMWQKGEGVDEVSISS